MAKLGWLGIGAAGAMAAGGLVLARQKREGLLTVERDGIMIPRAVKPFLERLHRAHQLGMELAKLAQERAEREVVRTFGAYLEGEHEKADYTLQLECKQLGVSLGKPLPSGPTELAQVASQDANLAKLKRLHGLAFDHAFLAVVLGDADHSIGQLKLGAEHFSDGKVGDLCKTALASAYVHRRKAYELIGETAPDQEFLGTGDHGPVVQA